jgi:aryl-alcohol dehydrogenase-like predicted oxidoreductase/predicted kinase
LSALPIGLGCMRLSTEADRDEERALGVIEAAIDAGATLLDTADAYAWDESERGHNERMIARALGARTGVRVASKGGLTRPGGRWEPNGRASHLREACERSLRALGRDRIDLYQLHAPDPRVELRSSVRALAELAREGLATAIGLCNVSAAQIREALELAPIASVQIAISPFEEKAFRSGVIELCAAHGIWCLAHSPLGGPKRAARLARDPALKAIGEKYGTSAQAIAIAWLRDLGVVALPGPTQPEHAREVVRGAALTLDQDDRRALDARFPLGRSVREPRSARRPAQPRGEVVLVMGIPGAGKTTLARQYVERGYGRLNRDERGGTLKKLARALDRALAAGELRMVLDNTYPTRASRDEVIEIAHRHALEVRCVWIDTPIEEAQINAVSRMLDRYGRLLMPAEMETLAKKDPNAFDPRAQFRWLRGFEPPSPDEGYASLERISNARAHDPRFDRAAVVVSLDAFADADGRVREERAAKLRAIDRPLFATAWHPSRDPDAIERCHAEVRAQLGRAIEIAYCTHPAGPPICWCRKPLPGLALVLMRAHSIDPARSIWVGTSSADRTLAQRLGFAHEPVELFFGS